MHRPRLSREDRTLRATEYAAVYKRRRMENGAVRKQILIAAAVEAKAARLIAYYGLAGFADLVERLIAAEVEPDEMDGPTAE